MKKIFLALIAISVVFVSCVKNDPYVEITGSELAGSLFLNEVNGTGGSSQLDAEKYVEFYNKTDADINLENFVLEYGGKETWKGHAEDVVPAHGYKLIKGAKTVYPGMSQGLSPRNANVNLSLLDAGGAIIDYYEKVEDLNGTPLEQMDHMRIPDGGKWYFVEISAQSPGAANLTDPNNPAVRGEMPSMEQGLKIEDVTVTPTNPTPDKDVTVVAKVTDVNTITSVVLKWKKDGADQSNIEMTKDGDNYSATISKQPDGTTVDWTIVATNSKNNTVTETGTLTWVALSADYTKLVINEVNGVGKWFEIYNTGDVDINLNGVTVYYSNKEPAAYNITWTGDATMTIPAKGFYSTQGTTLGTGLSANNANVRLQLRDPGGAPLDTYEKLIDINTGYDPIYNKSHARIPDGTGPWYYTPDGDGTPGATNGTSTDGCIQFGNEDEAVVVPPPATVDYTNLVINEVDGNGKFVEIYNKGTESLSLENVVLVKNESGVWWKGVAATSISAGGYYVIAQSGGTATFDEDTGGSGISAKQTLKFELKDPNANVIDQFSRGVAPWSTTISDVSPNSYSRCPDGTGDFKLATPSPKAANPATGADIPQS